jgi:hypothetical protein
MLEAQAVALKQVRNVILFTCRNGIYIYIVHRVTCTRATSSSASQNIDINRTALHLTQYSTFNVQHSTHEVFNTSNYYASLNSCEYAIYLRLLQCHRCQWCLRTRIARWTHPALVLPLGAGLQVAASSSLKKALFPWPTGIFEVAYL